MIVINTVSNERFSLNGIEYFKNFLSFVYGDNVGIYNAYDKTDQRVSLDLYSNFIVDGIVYESAALLQSALLGVIYTRDTLGAVNTVLKGSVKPTDTPTGTGVAFWVATQAGTYTNFGGVVVSTNSFAVISRDAAGAFSISQTTLDISSKVNISDVVNHLTSTSEVNPVSALQAKILNEKISTKATLIPQKNLFNKLDSDILVNKFFGAVGEEVAVTNYHATGFIPVLAGQVLTTNFKGDWGTSHILYNENKVFLSSIEGQNGTVTATVNGFVRFSLLLNSGQSILDAPVQVEFGSASTTYEPYEVFVPNSQLNLTPYAKKTEIVLKADLIGGKNIFNKNDSDILINKFFGIFGEEVSVVNYHTTGFIPVLSGQTLTTNFKGDWGTSHILYNENKVFLSSIEGQNGTVTATVNGFVRFSLLLNSGQSILDAPVQVEFGSASTTYEPFRFLVNRSQLPNGSLYNNKIASPLKQHFLTTIENNIYLDEFQKRVLPDFVLETNVPVGIRKNNILRALNPPAGTYNVQNALVDLDYNDVDRKNYSIVVSNLSKTTPIKVLSIGDSYTDIGEYVYKMGQTIPNVTHLGICKKTGANDVNREGRSGWTLSNYMNNKGANGGNDTFSPFLHPTAPYKYYGNTAFWKKVYEGTAPSYSIASFNHLLTTLNINSQGVKATPNVNDLMYFTNYEVWDNPGVFKYWNGSTWVEILEAALNFTLNFSKYLTTWSVNTPDVVTILLGMNDFRDQHPSAITSFFTGWKSNMDVLIASIKTANASAKIVIATCNSVQYNEQSGRCNASIWEGYNEIINEYDNREVENIFISDTKSSADRVFGYYFLNEKPFELYTGSYNTLMTNGDVHLAPWGMNQIGEKLAATIQYIRP